MMMLTTMMLTMMTTMTTTIEAAICWGCDQVGRERPIYEVRSNG